ncbi:FHA domain-containing protein [Phycicoccus sp. 3266]|jgi:pSer/pThr/pTyr-binding forkhead associated (FHA) protein|uniref:FHA domain-containing protein FhaB/FipA n=1 Tax=Phycicoccus sp. 3266 TaxID=2817751 RepID=UPI00285B57A9|nr:FHA domain-containing protein [Phycicoccus sp. 3266]MDR6863264.1 pSer/pThr/pTyr-binding forkhead associated (FHA) protein [Phycicoccus sp. 3266]
MSELTLTIIRLGLLVLLWVFVFSVVGVLRGDLYGTRVMSRTPRKPSRPARGPAAPPAREQPRPAKRQPHSTAPRTLVVTQGSLTGTSLPLREAGTVIGRNPECALVLDDDFASGRHARVFQRDGAWFIEDLGSTNGTWLGTQRLTEPVRVEAGTSLRIGKTVIELRR